MDYPDLQRKTEDFLQVDVYPIVKNYPKAEKFALSQETKQCSYRMLRCVTMANGQVPKRSKERWLHEAEAEMNYLLILFKTANTERYLTDRRLADLQRKCRDLGALIGGSLRHLAAN